MPNAFLSAQSSTSSTISSPATSSSKRRNTSTTAPSSSSDASLSSLITQIESFGHSITSLSSHLSLSGSTPSMLRDDRLVCLQQRDAIKRAFMDERAQRNRRIRSGEMRQARGDYSESRVLERLEVQFQELKQKLDSVLSQVADRERELSRKMREEMYSSAYGMGQQQGRGNNQGDLESDFLDPQQKQLQEMPIMLSEADASTIEVEKMIARETRDHLLVLESDMDELQSCLQDLNHLVKDQQAGLDQIQNNVVNANRSIEVGINDIKASKGMSFTEQFKAGLSKPMKMWKFASFMPG